MCSSFLHFVKGRNERSIQSFSAPCLKPELSMPNPAALFSSAFRGRGRSQPRLLHSAPLLTAHGGMAAGNRHAAPPVGALPHSERAALPGSRRHGRRGDWFRRRRRRGQAVLFAPAPLAASRVSGGRRWRPETKGVSIGFMIFKYTPVLDRDPN
jgi:hypothetical protein